jgi:hypothetical protein
MTTSSGSVPDGVSPQYLQQLLEQSRPFIPVSTAIPKLSFGGEAGGICDLALAVALLLTGTGSPCNPTQSLVMVISMISQLIVFYEEAVAECEAKGMDSERIQTMQDILDCLRSAVYALEPVTAMRIELSATFRLARLLRSAGFEQLDEAARESLVMVSDEVLAELNLSRGDVDKFLKILLPGLTS